MCDSSDSYIVLKEKTDDSSYYVVQDLDCDSDLNTIILEQDTCDTSCFIKDTSCSSECKPKCVTKEKYKCNKYVVSDFCMKTFEYKCYID